MKKILIVEDDESLGKGLDSYFQKNGYDVLWAKNAEEAISLNNGMISIILLDINLPGKVNGLDLLQNIRSSEDRYHPVPIIMLTNQVDKSVEDKAMSLGADGYLVKSDVILGSILQIVAGKIEKETFQQHERNIILTSDTSKAIDKLAALLSKPANETSLIFIPTGADPFETRPWLEKEKNSLKGLGFRMSEMDLKESNASSIKEAVSSADMVYVAGGDIFYLMHHVINSGFFEVVKYLMPKDAIYIGSSAGAMITSPTLEPYGVFRDENSPTLDDNKGLGLVDFLILPHADNSKYLSFQKTILEKYSNEFEIIPLNDDQLISIDPNGKKVI